MIARRASQKDMSMSSVAEAGSVTGEVVRPASARAEALAVRLETGARALVEFAKGLSDAEWQTPIPHDTRKVGVVVHHVAFMYPIEIDAARTVSRGEPFPVPWEKVHEINAQHAKDYDRVSKAEALDLLLKNSVAAAAAIRTLTDADLDRTASFGMTDGTPMTTQFVLEDHAVRHSYHHLAVAKRALKK
jgi:hypothetical protein